MHVVVDEAISLVQKSSLEAIVIPGQGVFDGGAFPKRIN